MREAANRDDLLDALRALGPIEVRVLTGPDEARLGAEAALRSMPVGDATIVDLGGGSLEMARVRSGRVVSAASLPLGCTRLTERFLASDPPAPNEIRVLRETTRDLLRACSDSEGASCPFIALGGTVRALARLHAPRRTTRLHGTTLRLVDIANVRDWLGRMSIAERRELPSLKADRADIIVAGIVALEELMLHGGHDALTVSSASVREGVLLREARATRGLANVSKPSQNWNATSLEAV